METLNFFSHETHVSLALPIGWEELKEEKANVIYYYEVFEEGDESYELNPRFMIQLFPMPNTDASNLERASKSNFEVEHVQLEKLTHQNTTVDGYPGVVDVFTYQDQTYDTKMLQFQTFVLVDNVLFSFTGLSPDEYRADIVPMFEDAVNSVRFIFEF